MSYTLSFYPDVEADVEEIASYIGERSFDGMIRWLDAYENALARIVSDPLICSPAPEEPILGRGLKQVLFKTPAGNRYRILFVIDGTHITVVRVRGKGQPPLTEKDLPNG